MWSRVEAAPTGEQAAAVTRARTSANRRFTARVSRLDLSDGLRRRPAAAAGSGGRGPGGRGGERASSSDSPAHEDPVLVDRRDPVAEAGDVERVAVEHDEVGPSAGLDGPAVRRRPRAAPQRSCVVATRAAVGDIPPATMSSSSRRFRPCGVTPLSVPIAMRTPAWTARRKASRWISATKLGLVEDRRRELHARPRRHRAHPAARRGWRRGRCRARA